MSYPVIRYGAKAAHLRKGSTPGFVEVWPGSAPDPHWRIRALDGRPPARLDRLTVAEAEAKWPMAVRALFGTGRGGQ